MAFTSLVLGPGERTKYLTVRGAGPRHVCSLGSGFVQVTKGAKISENVCAARLSPGPVCGNRGTPARDLQLRRC